MRTYRTDAILEVTAQFFSKDQKALEVEMYAGFDYWASFDGKVKGPTAWEQLTRQIATIEIPTTTGTDEYYEECDTEFVDTAIGFSFRWVRDGRSDLKTCYLEQEIESNEWELISEEMCDVFVRDVINHRVDFTNYELNEKAEQRALPVEKVTILYLLDHWAERDNTSEYDAGLEIKGMFSLSELGLWIDARKHEQGAMQH